MWRWLLAVAHVVAAVVVSEGSFTYDEEAAAKLGPYKVSCEFISIPSLHKDPVFGDRKARVCSPTGNGTFPLHLFAHGNIIGGPLYTLFYHALQEQIASFGFVVPAYISCMIDNECSTGGPGGQASFLEALKTIVFLEANPGKAPVDFSKAYSVSGHSTGGRVALMLGALRDNAAYLANTTLAGKITPSMRASIKKIKAVVGDHPDPMYTSYDPDIPNFKITKTPVFIITGSEDILIEPKGSGWGNFQMLSTPDKVFINVHGVGHMEPNTAHLEGPFIAYFSQHFALGDVTAGAKIYGDGEGTLQKTLPLAQPGDDNLGDGKVAFLACSSNSEPVPKQYAKYCDKTPELAQLPLGEASFVVV